MRNSALDLLTLSKVASEENLPLQKMELFMVFQMLHKSPTSLSI